MITWIDYQLITLNIQLTYLPLNKRNERNPEELLVTIFSQDIIQN